MAIVELEADQMARRAAKPPEPMGPIVAENLFRLGYASIVVHSTELSNLVAENTDRTMSRQRIAALMNAVRIEPETLEVLAEAIGVDPCELLKRPK
jgi:hypothetical protein